MDDEKIEKKYEKAFSQIGAVQTIFPANAKREMTNMIEQILKTDRNINNIVSSKQEIQVKAGFIAEELHAEASNLEAIKNHSPDRAITPKYGDIDLKEGTPTDILWKNEDGESVRRAQVKYYKNHKETYRDLQGNKKYPHKYRYKNEDDIIVPSDQANEVRMEAKEKLIKEIEKGTRSDVIDASKDILEKVKDYGGPEDCYSKPLSKKEAHLIAQNMDDGRAIRENRNDEYLKPSIKNNMVKAAKGAATFSAITSGVYNIILYLKMVNEGKITEFEAVTMIVAETASSAADSAIKAASNTGVQSMLQRYGAKSLTKSTTKQLSKNLLKGLSTRTNTITIAVSCGIDLIKDLVKLSRGKINSRQFEERNGKNLFNTSAGVIGGTIGTEIGGNLVSGRILANVLPFAGGLTGGLIAGLAMQFAIENHIEKPYKELLENTALLNESMQIFQEVSNRIFQGQIVFNAYLHEEKRLGNEFNSTMKRIDDEIHKESDTINSVRSAIDKL